jgi:hypothetical protein
MGGFPSLSFFSFAEITDPTQHRAFNEYHQLDHRPANLALPCVYWGERFVRTPACAAASQTPDPRYAGTHYVNFYLFRDASKEARWEWTKLGSLGAYWGRKPDHDWSRREVGFFETLNAWSHPRVRVEPEVLPMRPNRGIHVTVEELAGDPGRLHELGAWVETVRVPDLLTCAGVAGVWTAVREDGFPANRVAEAPAGNRPTMVTTVFLDGDPVRFAGELAALPDARPAGTTLLFASPLETIIPWQWDWFDATGAQSARLA